MHGVSAPSGRPVGYVLEFADGRSLYHEGDTWIFGDMALIQEFYHPNIILMPVGAVADGEMHGYPPQFSQHYGALPGRGREENYERSLRKSSQVVFWKPGGERKSF